MKKIILFFALFFITIIGYSQGQDIYADPLRIWGKTGIGDIPSLTYTPLAGLHLMGNDLTYSAAVFQLSMTTARAGLFYLLKSRGTLAAKTTLIDNDSIYRIIFSGWNGVQWLDDAQIYSIFKKNVVTGYGGSLFFDTRDVPTNLMKNRLYIDATGNTNIANGYLYLLTTPAFASSDTTIAKALFRNVATGEVQQRGISASSIGGWALLGNAGTVDGTNFIGTTDNVPLSFRVNNVLSGKIDYANSNFFYGYRAGNITLTGTENSLFGGGCGNPLTSGSYNSTLGSNAGGGITSGSYNTANGCGSLTTINTTNNNIGFGYYAGRYTNLDRRLFINSLDRSDIAGDTIKSIIYGRQHATASTQSLCFNSQVYLPYLNTVGDATDSVLVIDPTSNKIKFVAPTSIFDSTAFLNACHPVLRFSQWDACSPAVINTDEKLTIRSHGVLDSTTYVQDTASITSTATGVLNSTTVTQDTMNYSVIVNADTSIKINSNGNTKIYKNLTVNDTIFISTTDTIMNDGDTSRWVSSKPIKIGRNSVIIADDIIKMGSNVSVRAGDTVRTDYIKPTNGEIQISANDSIKLEGNVRVGIGATAYTLPITDGSTGEVMKTDGSGALSWSNTNIFSSGDSIMLISPDLSDTNYIFNDNDTLRIRGDNPIKIGNNSLIISDDLSRFGGTVEVKNGDTLKSNLIIPSNSTDMRLGTGGSNVGFFPDSSQFYNIVDFTGATVLGISTGGDTSYGHIKIIRPNALDTLIPATAVDLVANTTLFPKGSYFHFYKGSYAPTVNLARDSCVFYFDGGTIVTKTTAGAMFDYSTTATYVNDINILGYGSFYHTTNSGQILLLSANTNAKVCVFRFNVLSTTISEDVKALTTNMSLILSGNKLLSSGNICVYTDCSLEVNCNYIFSSAERALNIYGTAFVNSKYVLSTGHAKAVYLLSGNITLNAGYVQGINYGVCCGAFNGNHTINANANGLYLSGGNISYSGISSNLVSVSNDVKFTGGLIMGIITISGGYINTCSSDNTSTVTISGGQTKLYFKNVICNQINVSGGKLEIIYDNIHGQTYPGAIAVSGTGYLIINGVIEFGRVGNQDTSLPPITQTGGTIYLKGGIKDIAITYSAPASRQFSVISKTGGTLILNSAILIKQDSYKQFINCPTSAQNIKIYSGGCNTNGTVGSLLSAKARKDSLIVTAVAITTIILNDGSGGAETFTETDVVTYSTTALMAARMAALINASGTLDITATYVANATFNIESDVAGTNYTQSGLVNLTNAQLRLNSFAITNIITGGGVITEDPDVTY